MAKCSKKRVAEIESQETGESNFPLWAKPNLRSEIGFHYKGRISLALDSVDSFLKGP